MRWHSAEIWAILKQPRGLLTSLGLGLVFATNVLGHYIMVKELESLLINARPSRVVWVSSRTSSRNLFSWDDLQHLKGPDAYGSSKFLCDTLSIALNEKLRDKGVFVYTVCPGYVFSSLTASQFLSPMVFVLGWILSLIFSIFRMTPKAGSDVLFWLSEADPYTLDTGKKYVARLFKRLGTTSFPRATKEEAFRLCDELDKIAVRF